MCRKLYCEFGGNAVLIEKAMRKEWLSWSKQLLYDKNDRHGWIVKYGFDKSLQLHGQTKIGAIENDDERRYRAVVKMADHWQELALQGEEKAVDKFIKLTDQQINLRSKLDLSTANFETFVESWDLIVKWAKEIDAELAKLFYRRKDEFIEKAEIYFGQRSDN